MKMEHLFAFSHLHTDEDVTSCNFAQTDYMLAQTWITIKGINTMVALPCSLLSTIPVSRESLVTNQYSQSGQMFFFFSLSSAQLNDSQIFIKAGLFSLYEFQINITFTSVTMAKKKVLHSHLSLLFITMKRHDAKKFTNYLEEKKMIDSSGLYYYHLLIIRKS